MSIKMWCPNVIYSLPERADLTNKSLSSSNTGCSQPPVETRVGLMIPFFVCLFICFLTCHSLTCCQWKLGKLWALSCYPLSWCCIDLVWGILSRSLMGATGFQFCLYFQTHDSQIAPPLCSHAFLSLKPMIDWMNYWAVDQFCDCLIDWFSVVFLSSSQTHILAIPPELVAHIFKWVVSTDPDMKSIEQLALVRRNFHAEFKTFFL